MDAEEKPAESDNMKEQVVILKLQSSFFLYSKLNESIFFSKKPYLLTYFQPLSAKNETSVSPNSSQDTAPSGHPRDTTGQLGAFGSPGDRAVYPPNIYAPQAQAYYYRG